MPPAQLQDPLPVSPLQIGCSWTPRVEVLSGNQVPTRMRKESATQSSPTEPQLHASIKLTNLATHCVIRRAETAVLSPCTLQEPGDGHHPEFAALFTAPVLLAWKLKPLLLKIQRSWCFQTSWFRGFREWCHQKKKKKSDGNKKQGAKQRVNRSQRKNSWIKTRS